MYKVFVFGTLKDGFPNFDLNNGLRLPGSFRTQHTYPLYLVGERHVPWLVLDESRGHNIRGEIYDVSGDALAIMDELEQTSEPDGYRRLELDIYCEKTGQELKAQVYTKSVQQLAAADIRNELEDEYTLEHARLYSSRSR